MKGWWRIRVGLALCAMLCAVAVAQTAPASPPGAWAFDVASIRPGTPERRTRVFRHPDDTEWVAQNVTLSAILQAAFGVSESRVLGVPGHMLTARFDVQAKGDADTDARFRRLTPDQRRLAKQTMLQALLAERCQLVVHREMRELPVYALEVAKGGPKLHPSDEETAQAWSWWNHINVEGGNTMERFAEELTRVAGRPVLDRTGLPGHYTLEFEWSDDDDDDADVPTLFTAIRQQLGLKLEPQKAMVEVVVVDHLELPSAN